MLKYCFSNDCPCDEKESCGQAAIRRTPRLSSISFRQSETFARDGRKKRQCRQQQFGHTDILKYFVEERKISLEGKFTCVGGAAMFGRLDCLKYLVEEAKVPLNDWRYIACARYFEHTRVRKLLARKRVPRTNGQRIRFVCQGHKAVSEQAMRR